MAAIINPKEVYELSEYLKVMETRLGNLRKIADENAKKIAHETGFIKTKEGEIVHSLADIKKEIMGMKEEIRLFQKETLHIIEQLKTSVKKDDLERFKKRVDAWSPEALVSRSEAQRVIKNI